MLRKLYGRLASLLEIKQDAKVEYLEFQADRAELENQPFPFVLRATLYAVVAAILIAIFWACIAKVDKVVVATGKIVSTAQTVVIHPMEVSIIKKFEVEVGQIVEAGQVLVRLDPTFSQADAHNLASRKAMLALQIARLGAELKQRDFTPEPVCDTGVMENEMALFKGRRDEYRHRLAAYQQHIEELSSSLTSSEQQLVENEKQIAILSEIEFIYESLYKKKIQSRADYLNAKYQKASKQADISRLTNEIAEKKRSIARIASEKDAFLSKWNNDISTEMAALRKEYDTLSEELTKAAKLHDLSVLTAPRLAVVLQFGNYSEGSVARVGEPILTLVPLDAPLEAEVYIAPGDIGYVRDGDACRLKLDTLPFQKHGTLAGKLRSISDDTVSVEQLDFPVYKGRIVFDAASLANVPAGFRFLPGMSMRSEIKVGQRRVISFLLYPLMRVMDESIREP